MRASAREGGILPQLTESALCSLVLVEELEIWIVLAGAG